jgi:hypothetical protein
VIEVKSLKLLFVHWEFRTCGGIGLVIPQHFMNTRRFVSGSSVILAAWLGATFLNEVPAQRYPKRNLKAQTPATDQRATSQIRLPQSQENFPVSVSR